MGPCEKCGGLTRAADPYCDGCGAGVAAAVWEDIPSIDGPEGVVEESIDA